MTNATSPYLSDALLALSGATLAIADAQVHVPNQRGLYAIYGSKQVWNELGMDIRDAPLYVGKAERSLASRDLNTHFATGKTGSSTLRRSLAALLCESLGLVAIPRNVAKPSHFSNFALERDGDLLLTEWMRANLRIVVWPAPEGASPLVLVERAVLDHFEPPLNLKDVQNPWARLAAARAAMAAQAKVNATANPALPAPTSDDVISFVARYFDEDRVTAAGRLRRRRYGWQIDTQPVTGELLLGSGPLIVDGYTGDYWETSSSPWDVFGDSGSLGWSELKSRSLFEQWKSEKPWTSGNVISESVSPPEDLS